MGTKYVASVLNYNMRMAVMLASETVIDENYRKCSMLRNLKSRRRLPTEVLGMLKKCVRQKGAFKSHRNVQIIQYDQIPRKLQRHCGLDVNYTLKKGVLAVRRLRMTYCRQESVCSQ